MNVDFTPEQEARLSQIAAYAGTDTEHLVKDSALRLLVEDAKFRAAVREGIAQADRGELIDHDEVVARIESRLQSAPDRGQQPSSRFEGTGSDSLPLGK